MNMKPRKSSDKKPAKSRSAPIATTADEKQAAARETRKHAIVIKRAKLFRATQELERIRSEMMVEFYELEDEYDRLSMIYTAP